MAGYIAGIGGANVDIHGQSDAPIVMRDSNPGRLHLSAGGVCRNICDNLCRLGLTVELCSAVGGDAYGDMLRGACTAAGIWPCSPPRIRPPTFPSWTAKATCS